MNITSVAPVSGPVALSGYSANGASEEQIASLRGQIQSLKTDAKTDTKKVQQLEAELRELEARVRQRDQRTTAARLPPASAETVSLARLSEGSGLLLDMDI